MDYVWAPWRMTYILSDERPHECIFCAKPREERDRENGILWRGALTYVILNAYPYNPGHVMVVPYEHAPGLEALAPATAAEMMELTRRSIDILTRAMSPQGVNTGVNQGAAAGAGIVDHVHQHVVPRWVGDTNYMTAIGRTKVLPELLSETYARLAPLFASS